MVDEGLSSPSVTGSTAVSVGAGGIVSARDTATGQERWRFVNSGTNRAPAIANGIVYLAADTEQRIYALALLSFVVIYGLEHMVLVNREHRRKSVAAGDADAVFWLQLAGYAAYSALIGYLVIERAERGVLPLVAYTFAMAVHFLIVDHALEEEHGRAYQAWGRRLLAASVLVGWLIGVMAPLSEVAIARLFAVLAGGVVITSLRAELPDDREGRFWPFCIGAMVFAAALIVG